MPLPLMLGLIAAVILAAGLTLLLAQGAGLPIAALALLALGARLLIWRRR
ncbi:MAG: hypothetical protein H5U17_08545 [Defluviimonas sp.]|nr:hypothetical protein [Defluviimonas sp.]